MTNDQVDRGVVEVPLTQGKVALISPEDAERVLQFKWCTMYYSQRTIYAVRRQWIPELKRQVTVRMHRFILDAPQGVQVDHKDHNGLNNVRSNLRLATNSQNQMNSRLTARNESGYRGVYYKDDRGKWEASITVRGKHKFIGHYDTAIDAALAYDVAAIKLHGEFASLNFPGGYDGK